MRIAAGAPVLASGRFKRVGLKNGYTLLVDRSAVLPEELSLNGSPLEKNGAILVDALKESDFALERDGKFFLKISQPIVVHFFEGISVKIFPELTPSVCVTGVFAGGKGILVLGKEEAICDRVVDSFEDSVRNSYDIPKFLRDVRENSGILGIVAIAGKVVGTWAKGKLDVL